MKLVKLIVFILFCNSSFGQNKPKLQKNGITSIEILANLVKFLNLSPNEKIADIGTGTGYSLIKVANACPECKFDVEDIDSTKCNKNSFNFWINKTNNLSKIENFTFYLRNDTTTNLPSSTYDKVLISDVIHELTYKKEMLNDIKRILKKDGQVFIEEILVSKTVKKDKKCTYPFLQEVELKKIMADNNFLLKREIINLDAYGRNKYIKVFEYVVGL